MKQNQIFITGANGFIGRRVVEILSEKHQVVAVLRRNSLPGFELNQNIQVVYADLTDLNSLLRQLPKNATIINLAANPYHPKLSFEVNVTGTQNLIQAAKKNHTKLLIHISSQATKIEQKGVYAQTKIQSDEIVKKSGIPYVILKPSLVYGEGERGLFSKISKLAQALPVIPVFGDGSQTVSPIYIDDFAKIICLIIDRANLKNQVFDVGSEKPITYNQLYRGILATDNNQSTSLLHIPVSVGLILAWVLKILPHPPIYRDNILGSTQPTFCQPKPLLNQLKFKPLSFSQGMSLLKGENKVRVAVIGLGKMGTLHLSILSVFADVKIVALIDTNPQLFKTVKSMGIEGNYYANLETALEHEKIEAVYILTPTFTHFKILKTALAHQLQVFLEKPAFLNLEQLNEAKKLRSTCVIHIGYTLLYSRIYQEVKKIISQKTYGKVLGFNGKFEHGEVFGPKKGWMFNKNLSGGGVLMNPGPHFFSLLQFFFGQPNQVNGKIVCRFVPGLDDEAKLELDYIKYRGAINLSWSVKKALLPLNYFEIQLEKALLITDGQTITIKLKTGKVKKIQVQDLIDQTPVFDINPQANGRAYYLENRAFIDAIKRKTYTAPNTLDFALKSEATIFEAYKKCQN